MAEANSTLCLVDGCGCKAVARGLCGRHYRHWREGMPGISPLASKKPRIHSVPVKKINCGHCLEGFKPERHRNQYCSRQCHWAAMRTRKPSVCLGCHIEFAAKNGQGASKDQAQRFCAHECFSVYCARIVREVDAIKRMGDRRRRKEAERYKRIVAPEARAILGLGARMRLLARECPNCSKEFVRRLPFSAHCSHQCKVAAKRKYREEYKLTEAYKSTRRAARSRRRAMMRGAQHDHIDPIKVFQRDKWWCHLCGIKTPKRLRGTIEDKAPELEHIVSLADGGTHTWGNVACSCRKCNRDKGARSIGQLGLSFVA